MKNKIGKVREVSRDFVVGKMFTNLLISVEEDPNDDETVKTEDMVRFIGKPAIVSVDISD